MIDVANGDDGELADSQILAGDGGAATFTISPAALATSVGTANTIIQANDTITQNAGSPIDLSGGAANSLSMTTTTGDITLNDTFTGSGGDVNLDAGGSVVLNDALSNSGDLNITATEITSGVSGSIVVSGATDLQSTGPITLDNSGNDFGGAVSAAGTDIELVDTNALDLGSIAADSLDVTVGGDCLLYTSPSPRDS